MATTPLLTIKNLRHTYPGAASLTLPNWQLPAQAQALVSGPSGCGKTTLLQLITGILPVQQGEVVVLGQPLHQLTVEQQDAFRGKHLGLVLQTLHLIPVLTVSQNLALARQLAGLPADTILLQNLLTQLGVAAKANLYPHQLSQGEAQRVAIARALVHQPQLIVADEPTSALDDANANTVCTLLQAQAKRYGAGLIVVSHDQRLRTSFKHHLTLGGKK
jgi:putative ABC transport system ATP-binding protein